MQLSESQADRWHASDARAVLPVHAGGEHSGSHAPCFNTFRDASKTPKTEPVSGTATLPPQIWIDASGIRELSLLGCTQRMCLQASAWSREKERGLQIRQIWFQT